MTESLDMLAPVVVTRAEGVDGPLSMQLRELGVRVLLWPATHSAQADCEALDVALARASQFDWIVFASRRAVAAVLERMPKQPAELKVAAVGAATAQVLTQRGWRIDVVPDRAEAGALIDAWAPRLKPGARVLYPASSRALPTIAQGLKQLGIEVTQVEAYRTERAALDVQECRRWIERGVGAVTFASPSAVEELEQALGAPCFKELLARAPAVALGPTTARALAERGQNAVLARSATLEGLARAALSVLQNTENPR